MKIKKRNRRKLLDITLEEVIEVLKLAGQHNDFYKYSLKVMSDTPRSDGKMRKWVRVEYQYISPFTSKTSTDIVLNIADNNRLLQFMSDISRMGTIYKVIKYLEQREFDLESATKTNVAYY